MNENEKNITLKQANEFVNSFVDWFMEHINQHSDVAKGRKKPDRTTLVDAAACAINAGTNCVGSAYSMPKLSFGKCLTRVHDNYCRHEASNLMTYFPPKKNLLRDELSEFGFEVFRSYETVLVDLNCDNERQNVNIHINSNVLIRFMTDEILTYFKSRAKDSQTNQSYFDSFMDAFFMSENKKPEIINNFGIVLIHDNNIRSYFSRNKVPSCGNYRLLNSKEMKSFDACQEKSDILKLKQLLGEEYQETHNVEIQSKHILHNVATKHFMDYRERNLEKDDDDDTYTFTTFGLEPLADDYVERNDALKQFKTHFDSEKKVIVIIGMTGCGKTEFAINIAHKYKQKCKVFMIDATSKLEIEKSFMLLYETEFEERWKEEEKIKNAIDKIFSKYKKNHNLVIFDNADCWETIENYLPTQWKDMKLKIVITSYCSEWNSTREIPNFVSLDIMSENEAIQLFDKKINYFVINYADLNTSENKTFTKDLISRIVNISSKYPLIIKQTAWLIFDDTKYDLNYEVSFAEKLHQKLNSFINTPDVANLLIDFDMNDESNGERLVGIYLSMVKIIKKINDDMENSTDDYKKIVAKITADVLNMMSFFASKNIPIIIFEAYCVKNCAIENKKRKMLVDVRDQLSKYFIIKKNGEMIYSIEKVIQIVNRKYLEKKAPESIEGILFNAFICLKEYVDGLSQKDLKVQIKCLNDLFPHISSIWEFASQYDSLVRKFIMNKTYNMIWKTSHFNVISQYNSPALIRGIISTVENYNRNTIEKLLTYENFFHKTPWHSAVESGNLDIVEYYLHLCQNLMDRVNNKIINEKRHWTPLHLAVKYGYTNIVKFLMEKDHKIGGLTKYGFTPIHLAALNNRKDIMELIINENNVNDKTEYEFTPLHFACQKNAVGIAKILVEKGANFRAQTQIGKTALHMAADNGHEDIVDFLLSLENTSDPKLVAMEENTKFTALHWAALNGHYSIVQKLLTKDNSLIDKTTSKGNTALHLAASNGHVEAVKVLMEFNPDIEIKNQSNETAYAIAKCRKIKSLIRPHILKKFLNTLK